MTSKLLFNTTFLLAIFISQLVYAQKQVPATLHHQEKCGVMENLEMRKLQDLNLENRMQMIEAHTQNYISNQSLNNSNGNKKAIITIPVVFHVVYNNSNQNIPDAQIMSQLDVLNEDFRRLNADTVNTPSAFLGVAADTEIEFCLAIRDPSGNPTTGITRTSTSTSGFSTNDNVKFNSSGGKDAWPCDEYLNFWICNFSGGLLGYAQFPGGSCNTDGVVCLYTSVGKPPDNPFPGPYNLGRTATHEVGHWLNLRHIWGDGGCSQDDFVSDTPISDGSNFGCPTGSVACSSTDMVENYMDYTDDDCMNIYTQGQKTRMQALFSSGGTREALASSLGCTPLAAPPIANFESDVTITCTGEVQFTDLSGNAPSSWLWDFGDGNTSTQENPVHIYANNGTYTVQLTVTNNYGSDSFTITSYIVVNKPTAPSATGASRCGPGSLTMSASGTGSLSWYDDSVGTNLLDTGISFTTPTISTSTNFYVMDVISSPVQNVGPADNTIGNGGNHTSTAYYLIFDCFSPFTLISVKVYANGAGIRTIEYRNSAGTILQSASVNLPDGESRVTLNFDILPGTNHQLATSGQSNMFRNNGGVNFPYTLPGIVSITGNNIPDPDYYYYYYDWEIREPNCTSEPTLVTATIYDEPSPNINLDNAISCVGSCDGLLSATISGGTPTYTYSWSNAQTTSTITGLCASFYDLTITDDNGCIGTDTITLTDPIGGNMNLSTSVTNATCGNSNGTATVTPNSGTSPYSYLWSDTGAQTNATATGLSTGTYYVTVTDGNGCIGTDSVTIYNVLPALSSTTTDVTCNGYSDGTATVNPSGGNIPYTYLWNDLNNQTNVTATGLFAGTYIVTVTDNAGCLKTDTINIVEPSAISIGLSATDASCGGSDGSATATPSGGTGSYTYLWNDPGVQTTSTATGLTTGIISVIITDNNSCQKTDSIIVAESSAITLNIIGSNVDCSGGCTGTADLTVVGGALPYTFNWSNGNTSEDISALCQGQYMVTVTDSANCISIDSVEIYNNVIIDAGADQTICLGQSIGLNGSFTFIDSSNIFLSNTNDFSIPDDDHNGNNYSNSNGIQSTIAVSGICSPSITAGSIKSVCLNIQHPRERHIDMFLVSPNGTWIELSTDNGGPGNNYTNTCFSPDATINITAGVPPFTGIFLPEETFANLNGSPINGIWTLNVQDDTGGNTGTLLDWSITFANDTCISWSPGTSLNDSNILNPIATPIVNTDYVLTIEDNHGCTAIDTVSVTVSSINISFAPSNSTCYGNMDGSINALVNGGTAPYTYLWDDSNSQTNANATGLFAGLYNVTITDSMGCSSTSDTTIIEPSELLITLSSTIASCGINNGTASAIPSGGTSPYTYVWNDPNLQTTSTATGLYAGTFTINITDNNGCTLSDAVNVVNPIPNLSDSVTNVSCNGGSDGSAIIIASGGQSPYTYNWINGDTTPTTTGLIAGTYSVTITDSANCVNIISISINEPSAISTILMPDSISCNGYNDGSIMTNISGGIGPYTYLWNDPSAQTNSTATALSAGTYSLIVTDTNGCFVIDSAVMYEPSAILISTLTSPVSCSGGNDGTANAIASGGAGNYEYSWSTIPVQTTNIATGLSGGTSYTVIVTDINICSDSLVVTLIDPPAIILSTSSTVVSCGSSDGSASVIVLNGGITPFSYVWSNGSTTSTATGLDGGVYNVTVTDANNCLEIDSVFVTEQGILTTTSSSTDPTCFGKCNGLASVSIAGGNGSYTYLWDDVNSQTNAIATGLCSGTYLVLIVDSLGCQATDTISLSEPSGLSVSIISGNSNCGLSNGLATATILGGVQPYTFSWSNNSGNTSNAATNLESGTYLLITTDNNNCSMTETFTIDNGTDIEIELSGANITCAQPNGSIEIITSGGTAPLTYQWSNGATIKDLEGINSGIYQVTVTDSNNCITTDSINIMDESNNCFNIPSGFTPNDDGTNDTWNIRGASKFPTISVKVFNRWGTLIFSSKGYNTPWDGTYNGKDLPAAVYYYIIKIDRSTDYSGSLTIYR